MPNKVEEEEEDDSGLEMACEKQSVDSTEDNMEAEVRLDALGVLFILLTLKLNSLTNVTSTPLIWWTTRSMFYKGQSIRDARQNF